MTCFTCGQPGAKRWRGIEQPLCMVCHTEHVWRNEAQAALGRAAVKAMRKVGEHPCSSSLTPTVPPTRSGR